MVSEYPKEQQNPPTEPGKRPDEQPLPRQRVPDEYHQGDGDPRKGEPGGEEQAPVEERWDEVEEAPMTRDGKGDHWPKGEV